VVGSGGNSDSSGGGGRPAALRRCNKAEWATGGVPIREGMGDIRDDVAGGGMFSSR
jgi:hypothetical protein